MMHLARLVTSLPRRCLDAEISMVVQAGADQRDAGLRRQVCKQAHKAGMHSGRRHPHDSAARYGSCDAVAIPILPEIKLYEYSPT